MILESNLPPVSFQSVVDGQWYIVTTGKEGKWTKVDRKYDWSEIELMWVKDEFKKDTRSVVILPKIIKKQTDDGMSERRYPYTIVYSNYELSGYGRLK